MAPPLPVAPLEPACSVPTWLGGSSGRRRKWPSSCNSSSVTTAAACGRRYFSGVVSPSCWPRQLGRFEGSLLLENIIHQGACLLFYSGWSHKDCLEEGTVRFNQKAVHDYLRDAFLEEGVWERTRVDGFERHWADPERKEQVKPLLQDTNKKDPSLQQELARAIIERYKEAREVAEDISIEKVDPGEKIHARGGWVYHPFAPAYGRFDRQNNEADPAAAEFFKFDRNLRRHARSEGNSSIESRLPPVAEGSSQFGGQGWHHVHGVKMVTAGLVKHR
ncbi:hypothetical protein I350_06198 [Cryptococcus amylolentus CBS 6273]|uniref:Uncharacterized protein n=1 Tax=Cryptococcus amylolentus CBS 6273 TaxID=1296118 RepID=A0A1E3JKH8_9TREE|nr:hypothetical protein I350_06198 [Cryptococcus amylolentus CBS 6273]